MYSVIITAASLATLTLARTDLSGCTSSTAGASLIWYVPETGELCDFLDCGGGRAPPKTTVPGCPQYSGTATYSPSYLPGYNAIETGSSSASAASSSDAESSTETEETGSAYAQTTGVTPSSAASASDESTITSGPSYTSTPAVNGGGVSNGTAAVGGSSRGNSTVAVATPSTSSMDPGAPMQSSGATTENAKVWAGSVAMLGLGAVVAVL